MTNSKYNAHTEPLFKGLEMLKVKNTSDVQCMKFWYKFVNKSPPEYFDMMFTFNNELYQIKTHGQNQLHLFPTGTVSTPNVLRHLILDLLQEYPRPITQRANTHQSTKFICGITSPDLDAFCKLNIIITSPHWNFTYPQWLLPAFGRWVGVNVVDCSQQWIVCHIA